MKRKKLAIIIPTYNRLNCIRYYLETQLGHFQTHGIDVIVYDSSEDSDIQSCVSEFCEAGFDNLLYKRYDNGGDTRAIDDKVFSACCEFCMEYEYLWFSSDGTIFQIDKVWPSVSSGIEQHYDLLVLNHINASHREDQLYSDSRTLLRDCGWILTMLGTGIVSTNVIMEVVRRFPVSNREHLGLWYPLAYFCVLAERPIKAMWLGCQNTYYENPYRTDAFWKVNGDALWQWGEVWVQAIEALPPFYDEVKADVIRSWDKHAKLFSIKGLMGMRAQGQITFCDVVKFRKYIKRITDTGVMWFYIITLPGNQLVLSWIRKIYRAIKKARRELQ